MNSITCPHCHREFDCEPLEEVANPTLTISRKSLDMSSWSDIADKVRSGYSYLLFNEGDTISCTLKNGKKIDIDVAGINVYGENEVVFCFKDCLEDDACMNERNTNAGGFPKSGMLNKTLAQFFDLLPDELQSVIKPRVIKQNISGATYENECKLWLPSIVEVFGEQYRRCECEAEAKQLPLFENPRNRVKHRMNATNNDNSYSIYWWLRSPYVGNSTFFWIVSYIGNTYYYGNAYYVYGVCPCFII